MSLTLITEVRHAIRNLNPADVRMEAERPLEIGLVAPTSETMWRLESFLCPSYLPAARRAKISRLLHRVEAGSRTRAYDIEIWDDSLSVPAHVFTFDAANPGATIEQILKSRPELALTLARHIVPFRKPVISHFIGKVARENALFSLATAIPDMIPLLSIPWIVGEFASDTAFLTANQIRLAFLIAAANDRTIGYREQRGQIGSIVASAFGFRALARELIGKIPFGGGLLPKAGVAYAGTQVVGRSLERFYTLGVGFTPAEQRSAFSAALERGREIAGSLLQAARSR